MEKKCVTCALWDKEQHKCVLLGVPMEEKDYCSKHKGALKTCTLCGQPYLSGTFVARSAHILCPECSKQMSSCQLCMYGHECTFETSTSPLPKVVMKNIQQGNMMMQTQVRNPEREKITCENGCPCWDKENKHCGKQDGFCGKHKFVGDTKR